MLSDEQMSKRWPFSLLNDEQMSNWVGVKHLPVGLSNVFGDLSREKSIEHHKPAKSSNKNFIDSRWFGLRIWCLRVHENA